MRSETKSFPAVLLALASLGAPFKTTPTHSVPVEARGVVHRSDADGSERSAAVAEALGMLPTHPRAEVDAPHGGALPWGSDAAIEPAASCGSVGACIHESVESGFEGEAPNVAIVPSHAPASASGRDAGTEGRGLPSEAVVGRVATDDTGEKPGDVAHELAPSDYAGSLDSGPFAPEAAVPVAADTVTLDPRMLRNLSRDFVSRLNRVADRMWTEHGMRLEVVEGYRTPRRQQDLFAQGRSAPGPVVTWTQNSLHSAGAAADVFVDGAPVGPAGAAILARITREEGLSTLHPYDSGHIQLEGLRRSAGPEGPLTRERPAIPGAAAPPRGVAPVAPTAPVARPARPGGSTGPSMDGPEVMAARPTPTSPTRLESPGAASVGTVGLDPERPTSGSMETPRRQVGPAAAGPAAAVDVGDQTAGALSGSQDRGARPPEAGRVDGGAVGTIRPLPEPTAPALFRRLQVPIDGVGGASLQLGIRPGSVDARLNISDPVLAQNLERNLPELRQTLASRGVDASALTVRVAPASSTDGVGEAITRLHSPASGDAPTGDSSTFANRERAQRFRERPDDENHPRRPRHDPSEEKQP